MLGPIQLLKFYNSVSLRALGWVPIGALSLPEPHTEAVVLQRTPELACELWTSSVPVLCCKCPVPMECAICLNRIDLHNESYIYPCFHRYCFTCIQRWSESQQKYKSVDQEATTCLCPLCKAPYTQIIYDCVGSSYRCCICLDYPLVLERQEQQMSKHCGTAGRLQQLDKPQMMQRCH